MRAYHQQQQTKPERVLQLNEEADKLRDAYPTRIHYTRF